MNYIILEGGSDRLGLVDEYRNFLVDYQVTVEPNYFMEK